MENLKEIGGFPGYCVDNTGNVFSVKTDVMLKPWKINGYNAVGLYRSGKRYVFLVHRLVAAGFISNPGHKKKKKANMTAGCMRGVGECGISEVVNVNMGYVGENS